MKYFSSLKEEIGAFDRLTCLVFLSRRSIVTICSTLLVVIDEARTDFLNRGRFLLTTFLLQARLILSWLLGSFVHWLMRDIDGWLPVKVMLKLRKGLFQYQFTILIQVNEHQTNCFSFKFVFQANCLLVDDVNGISRRNTLGGNLIKLLGNLSLLGSSYACLPKKHCLLSYD